jgi:hypothetical protein
VTHPIYLPLVEIELKNSVENARFLPFLCFAPYYLLVHTRHFWKEELLETTMVDHEQQQSSIRRKLSARISAVFRIQRQPSQFRMGQQRIENNNNNNITNDLTPRELIRQQRPAMAAAAERRTPATRRRLPRGWWPDQGKREGLKLKAMNDLKNETFVSVLLSAY